ncbi:MAG: DNA polymerase III subunit alpha [Amoebophilaceae bacterium]|nr:DNA polymerase III subunit alpha [Amoebophilaceae bacterium]
MHNFCHLHCHTDYSLLDGAAKVKQLIQKNKALGMDALAITDHGNMFGVPHFVAAAHQADVKPIVGCEFYLAADMYNLKDKTRFHQILLSKNEEGYRNLSRLSSMGFLEGYYYKPRIDKKLIKKYAKGLIATTCCLSGEVPRAIIRQGEKEAETIFLSWLELFGADYYIELQRHGIPEQEECNAILLKWAKKYDVKVIATNDVHYVEQKDHIAQDVLLCLQTGKEYNDPNRMRFENNQFFLKSPEEMGLLFKDVPEALDNTQEIVEKVSPLSLARDVLLPIFQLPKNFTDADGYLAHLAFTGARIKYGAISETIEQRIHYELAVIQKTGFAGYFLIVQDFIQAAQAMQVVVGPGRGSVAGSIVAYCIGITKVDPIHYNLLFERFLNPERVSMPDIDIDFDDEGRKKVIDYVVNKYGRNQVASIITFGSMAAKSAIKDVSRILGLPLATANYMAKLVPDKPGTTLAEAFAEVPALADLKKDLTKLEGSVLDLAVTLEGAVRHTGIHAAGIIIVPGDLLDFLPVKSDKNADLLVTQYDGSVLEGMGMLKMDFLGLKTLGIIKDTLHLVEKNYGCQIDIDKLPFDDEKTFALYQAGDTKATFQFESEGMRQWLKKLQPTNMEDLIAMNALYRPGPMQFIPNFIARKHGKEPIVYPHPLLEDLLKNTYGIMVYQEQIMETAQRLGGYSLGSADLLRRAMGKKKKEEMEQQGSIFIKGAAESHGIGREQALAVFDMMKDFAQYGFNRSHSAAYTIIAYQTAYLKAHYPAEYMASVLTHNQGDIEKIAFFMEESKQLGVAIQGPDINASDEDFIASPSKAIRFGLKAIKGAGDAAVTAIIKVRKEKGVFNDIYDFVESIPLKAVNKKTLECLALSGAFDGFKEIHRKQYVDKVHGGDSFIEKVIHYGNQFKKERIESMQSLFAASDYSQIKKPLPAPCLPYPALEQLRIEKELVGFYISGHPLDLYKVDMASFCNTTTQQVLAADCKQVAIAGILIAATVKQNSKGNSFALLTLEDYHGSLHFALFGEDYLKYKHYLEVGKLLFLSGGVATRYGGTKEFKPQTIYLLESVRERMAKGVHITVKQPLIQEQLVVDLEACMVHHPGKSLVKLSIVDQEEGISIPTLSKRYRVQLSDGFIQSLTKLAVDVALY